MIVFYDKTTGKIMGSIAGRYNTPAEMNMWVGDRESTERLIYLPADEHFEIASKDSTFNRNYIVDTIARKVMPIKQD